MLESQTIEFKGSRRWFLTPTEWETMRLMAPSYDEDTLRLFIELCGRKAGKLRKPALLRKLLSFIA